MKLKQKMENIDHEDIIKKWKGCIGQRKTVLEEIYLQSQFTDWNFSEEVKTWFIKVIKELREEYQ